MLPVVGGAVGGVVLEVGGGVLPVVGGAVGGAIGGVVGGGVGSLEHVDPNDIVSVAVNSPPLATSTPPYLTV